MTTRGFLESFALTIREVVEIVDETIERCKTSAFRRHIDCEFKSSIIEYKEEFGAAIMIKTMQFKVLKMEIEILAIY